MCGLKSGDVDHTCRITIASTLDIHRLMTLNHPQLAAYCAERDPTIAEARQAFMRVDARQGRAQLPLFVSGGVGVLMALRDTWPSSRACAGTAARI
jgi:hypothetical protein